MLKDGAKVELFGTVSVYANRGNYQFVARSARLAGIGDLMRRYLELKARLEREGLFDRSRKRPLPTMPRRIGIVTSESGAVIHDMCTVLTRRFPALEIRLYPCLVQLLYQILEFVGRKSERRRCRITGFRSIEAYR